MATIDATVAAVIWRVMHSSCDGSGPTFVSLRYPSAPGGAIAEALKSPWRDPRLRQHLRGSRRAGIRRDRPGFGGIAGLGERSAGMLQSPTRSDTKARARGGVAASL